MSDNRLNRTVAGLSLDIDPDANPFEVCLHYRSQGFTLTAGDDGQLSVDPFEHLSEHDLDDLRRVNKSFRLWAVVRTLEFMDDWGEQPVTLHRLTRMSPADACRLRLGGTSLEQLQALHHACTILMQEYEDIRDEYTAHLWSTHARILDAEIHRRAAHEQGGDQ